MVNVNEALGGVREAIERGGQTIEQRHAQTMKTLEKKAKEEIAGVAAESQEREQEAESIIDSHAREIEAFASRKR